MKGHKLIAVTSLLALAFSLVLVAPAYSEDPWDADVTGELGHGLGDAGGGSDLLGGETVPGGDDEGDDIFDLTKGGRVVFENDWFSRLILKFVTGLYVSDGAAIAQPTSATRAN